MSNRKVVIIQNSIKTVRIFRKEYIAQLLINRKVIVIAPNDDQDSVNELVSLGAIVKTVNPFDNLLSAIITVIKINFAILKERMDSPGVYINHFLITFLMTYPILVPFNKRLIVYIEGIGRLDKKSDFLILLLRKLLGKDNITRLFCNEDERNKLGKPTDVVTKGIGIDLERFQLKTITDERTEGTRVYQLLYVGRLIRDKGVVDAIECFRLLLAKGYDVNLSLVGEIYMNNPSSLSDKEITNYKNIYRDKINFEGFSHDIVQHYRNADFLLLPSIREGFPVCAMEANACGVPCFGYNVPGMSDAIFSGTNGELVDLGDVVELSEKIAKIIDTDGLYSYSLNSSFYAKDKFDQKIKNKELIDIINEVSN